MASKQLKHMAELYASVEERGAPRSCWPLLPANARQEQSLSPPKEKSVSNSPSKGTAL